MLIVCSPQQKAHAPSEFVAAGRVKPHPEVPARFDALLSGAVDGVHRVIEPADHGLEFVRQVHSEVYIDFLACAFEQWRLLPDAGAAVVPNVHPRLPAGAGYPRSIIGRAGYHQYDMACPIVESTWHSALWSAHAATEAALRVNSGAEAAAYALCRPPGHHAGADYAGGFCYLNNAAIAATVLRGSFAEVAVLDIDVHHGNGTQDIFYDRADVFTASLHGDPRDFYPFYSGYAGEAGRGAGLGANLNVPLPRGLGDAEYLPQLAAVLDRIRARGSKALVVALGFDTYQRDPLSWVGITTGGYQQIGAAIAGLGLPTVLIQEGGYFCADLGRNLAAFLRGFAGHTPAGEQLIHDGATT